MKYPKKTGNVSAPSVTGAQVGPPTAATMAAEFVPWLPSTWPEPPINADEGFVGVLERILRGSMLNEIGNVINDAKGDLEHRGHVVALSLLCATDAIASYGYRGTHMSKFIGAHFPDDYKMHCDDFYTLYRNSLVHSWNLFEATLYPGNETVKKVGDTLIFGLLNFWHALEYSVDDFLLKMKTGIQLQNNTLNRYRNLKNRAKP
jgi:hypothetical protein